MIMKNVSQNAKSLQIPDNIALIFLPPYSPELNPAEKIWRYFKDRVSMIAYNNIEMLQQQLSEITKGLNQNIIKSICGNQFYKKHLWLLLMSNWHKTILLE